VFTGAGHGVILLEFSVQGGDIPDFPFCVNVISPIYPLQYLKNARLNCRSILRALNKIIGRL
ncbi:MAG: hypothetical protein LBT05_16380, partial [Planctomycetaceae bacterium]|nr:hypothetical protein [Planctomycetaceae bacterium]